MDVVLKTTGTASPKFFATEKLVLIALASVIVTVGNVDAAIKF
jgi:hypothetical protein